MHYSLSPEYSFLCPIVHHPWPLTLPMTSRNTLHLSHYSPSVTSPSNCHITLHLSHHPPPVTFLFACHITLLLSQYPSPVTLSFTCYATQALIGHTVFALGFSRVFELIFWVGSFRWVYSTDTQSSWSQVTSDFLSLNLILETIIFGQLLFICVW